MLCNGLNIADNETYGYFTFQMIIEAHGKISDAVCVGSPVIIIIFTIKIQKSFINKYTKNLEFSTRVGTIAH